jgi:hypothetical protein
MRTSTTEAILLACVEIVSVSGNGLWLLKLMEVGALRIHRRAVINVPVDLNK